MTSPTVYSQLNNNNMAHTWKKVLRRENHDFVFCKNRHNSKTSFIIAFPKGDGNTEIRVGNVDNKTNAFTLNEGHGFKEKTIADLKKAVG